MIPWIKNIALRRIPLPRVLVIFHQGRGASDSPGLRNVRAATTTAATITTVAHTNPSSNLRTVSGTTVSTIPTMTTSRYPTLGSVS